MGSALQEEFCKMMSPPGRAKRKRQLMLHPLLYVDVLLADLGLVSLQMENPLLGLLHLSGPADYWGLIDEWKRRQ
jgi:hypothetical protein